MNKLERYLQEQDRIIREDREKKSAREETVFPLTKH